MIRRAAIAAAVAALFGTGAVIASALGSSPTQQTFTYTIPAQTFTQTVDIPTVTETVTVPATTTGPSAPSFASATAYTATPVPFTPTRTVNVASSSELLAAIAALQPGDLVQATAAFTVSGETVIAKALASPAELDLRGISFTYAGTSAVPAVWIHDSSNLIIYGGDVTNPSGNDGIRFNAPVSNVTWWGFTVHNTAGGGVQVFPMPGADINGVDLEGDISDWGHNLALDPHAEAGTGLQGAQLDDCDCTGGLLNSRFAFDVHDSSVGSAVQLGDGGGSPIANDTLIIRAQNLSKVATSQGAGNALTLWGNTLMRNVSVPYLEGDNLQGRGVETGGMSGSVSSAGVSVSYARATGCALNPQDAGGIFPGVCFLAGPTYGDVQPPPQTATPPPTTTAATTTAATTTAPTTTAATTTAPVPSYTFLGDFEGGNTKPFNQVACAGYQPPSSVEQLGTFALKSPGGQGNYYGEFSIPGNTSVKQRCQTVQTGATATFNAVEYFSLMLWVPASWNPTIPGWGPTIAELNYQTKLTNNTGKALELNVQSDHVTIQMATGQMNVGGQVFPNQTNADGASQIAKCSGIFKTKGYCSIYAIPPGKLAKGAWNEIIVGDYFTTASTGWVKAWFRPKGTSTWTQSADVSGIPTLLYDSTHDGSGAALEAIGLYRGPNAAPITVGLDGFSRSGSFAAAAAELP